MRSVSGVRVGLACVAGVLWLAGCKPAAAPTPKGTLGTTACREAAETLPVGQVAAELCSADVPSGRVVGLKVTLNGNGIYVPRSAYADLDDVASLALAEAPGGYHLTIRGGDTVDAYKVVLTFTTDRLTDRTLSLETGNVIERTAYLPMPVVD